MKRKRKAFITGITGQDGSYLAELLLKKGYEVYGLVRRRSKPNHDNIEPVRRYIHLCLGDLADTSSISMYLAHIQPDEIYHLGSQSHVRESWYQPLATADQTGVGALRIFEAVRNYCPKAKVYQASTSEMFGHTNSSPQDEKTPIVPANPYGAAKALAHFDAQIYRESFNLFISTGILFNHESPRRSPDFVTRKITLAVASIKLGLKNSQIPVGEAGEPVLNSRGKLELGNLDAKRDWGFAGDFVDAMWRMLQYKKPDDFVIATGEVHTVREFCQKAFAQAGLDWHDHVVINKKWIRPTETGPLVGNAAKARRLLKWKPKVSFDELVEMMVKSDLEGLQ